MPSVPPTRDHGREALLYLTAPVSLGQRSSRDKETRWPRTHRGPGTWGGCIVTTCLAAPWALWAQADPAPLPSSD